jgi:hypothetical protein
VVELFAELTSRYELLFCYTILEQNKRLILSTASSVGGSSGGATVTASQTANPLDCFFPFDPYTLKRYDATKESIHRTVIEISNVMVIQFSLRSRRYIEGLYTEWEEEEEMDDTEQVRKNFLNIGIIFVMFSIPPSLPTLGE